VDVSAKTGAVAALGPSSTLRSAEPAGTEAGLSVMQPTHAKRSNVGLLAAAGAGVAVLGAAAWFATGGAGTDGSGGAGPEGSLPAATGSDSAPAAVPEGESKQPPAPVVAPPPVAPPPPVASGTPSPLASAPAQPTAGTPPKSTAAPAAAPVPCSECIGLVGSGSWGRATQAYASCDAAGQKQCTAKAKREAPDQAERAAAAHKCTQAQAILKGATALGAVTSRVRSAVEKCR
jgi:hypothetical protein